MTVYAQEHTSTRTESVSLREARCCWLLESRGCAHSVRLQGACGVDHTVSLQCLTLCDPLDCTPPASSVQGTLQARTLQWVISFSRGSSPLGDPPRISCAGSRVSHLGSPIVCLTTKARAEHRALPRSASPPRSEGWGSPGRSAG